MRQAGYEPNDAESIERLNEAADKRAAHERKLETDYLGRLLREKWGRWLLWRQLPSRDADPFDPNALTMARNLGEQKSGRDLERLLQAVSMDNYLLMLKENLNEHDADATGRNDQS